MTSYLDIFGQKFEQAQQRLVGLAQQTAEEHVPKDILTQTLDELSNALEEVHVLSEELSEHHDQLQVSQITLATERQQYFDLFDLAPDGYIVTDHQGIIAQVNRAAATLTNRRPQFLVGKPLGALIVPADSQRFYTLLNRLQQGEAFQNFDLRLRSHQKSSLYGSFTITPIWDHRLQLLGFRWLFRDLTQQRQVAMILEESEARYRAIVEDQTELICRSLADGRLTFANQAFCQYFDRSSEFVIGTSFFDPIVAADLAMVMRQLATLDQNQPVSTLEHRVTLDDGQIRWQSWVHRALFDDQGNFFQFQSAGRDITAQKQAEEALRQREAQLRMVTDSLPILLAYVNAKQQVVYANRPHNYWLGMSNTDIVERYLWEVLGTDTYRQIRMPIEDVLSGKGVTFEQEGTLPDQSLFWMSATFVPDRLVDGEVKGFFVLVHDISDRKAIELKKDQLISVVSHELRTPLTTIHGALKLLTHNSLDPSSTEGQHLLAMAMNNTERMAKLVNDLLDLQQITLGKLSINPSSCCVADIIQSAIETLQATAQEHGICLETIPCSCSVWADCDRIIQVLTNLISNAIKFSPTGSTVLIIAGKAVDPNLPPTSPHIRFQVCDQGQGIPADNLERVFEAFHQVDASDSRHRGGAGLGLAICRGIIQQHGGSIRVESRLEQGTTVSFTLPYKDF
ncbi:PAS domain S-box protein [Leptothoe sp. PORK10 BA2]|uniref:PAS domain S-box protein n=1 Tax=Leptothoe sp. PORK10 BA2 TaxID=3110254 RepID=UPI002B1F3ACC|nr:PAS domain S-box protein [Leptothoe sp. PORK10 BA2]MEA5462429.1 PAS domain S-box protein [Leptothoe sp. PORK10 BA2]